MAFKPQHQQLALAAVLRLLSLAATLNPLPLHLLADTQAQSPLSSQAII